MTRDSQNDDKGQIDSLQYAINQGIKFIRTAQNYAEGHCETIVGQAIKDFPRNQIYLMDSIFENNAIDGDSIIKEIESSLKRLNTDYVDMLIIGGINPNISLKNVAKGLLHAKESGLAKDVGVGNYRLNELTYLDALMGGQLVYNELQYNLIVREPVISGTYDYQLKNNIILGAYRPLQLGQLSKKGINILDALALKYSRSQSAIALNWILGQEGTVVFPKSLTKAHIDELVALPTWQIDRADLELLTTSFPAQMRMGDCIPPVSSFTK